MCVGWLEECRFLASAGLRLVLPVASTPAFTVTELRGIPESPQCGSQG